MSVTDNFNRTGISIFPKFANKTQNFNIKSPWKHKTLLQEKYHNFEID